MPSTSTGSVQDHRGAMTLCSVVGVLGAMAGSRTGSGCRVERGEFRVEMWDGIV